MPWATLRLLILAIVIVARKFGWKLVIFGWVASAIAAIILQSKL